MAFKIDFVIEKGPGCSHVNIAFVHCVYTVPNGGELMFVYFSVNETLHY